MARWDFLGATQSTVSTFRSMSQKPVSALRHTAPLGVFFVLVRPCSPQRGRRGFGQVGVLFLTLLKILMAAEWPAPPQSTIQTQPADQLPPTQSHPRQPHANIKHPSAIENLPEQTHRARVRWKGLAQGNAVVLCSVVSAAAESLCGKSAAREREWGAPGATRDIGFCTVSAEWKLQPRSNTTSSRSSSAT